MCLCHDANTDKYEGTTLVSDFYQYVVDISRMSYYVCITRNKQLSSKLKRKKTKW